MFCSSVVSCFLNDLDMVPDTPAITGTTFDFTFHVRCIFTIIIMSLLLSFTRRYSFILLALLYGSKTK